MFAVNVSTFQPGVGTVYFVIIKQIFYFIDGCLLTPLALLVGVYPYISYQRFDSFFFFIRIKRKEQTHYASTQSDTGWLMDDDISLSSEAKQDPQCVGSSRTAHLSYVDVELLYSTTSVVKSRLKINHSEHAERAG